MGIQKQKCYKEIFISWSGEKSKQIARVLKNNLESTVFQETGLKCFVSDMDIDSGDDWWKKINSELKRCKLGIVCITKENLKAPWVFFESGAMIARDLKVIPLLFNCNIKALEGTPISSKNMVDFYNQDKFCGMIKTINKELSLYQLADSQLEKIAIDGYQKLLNDLSPTLKQLKSMRVFNEKYIFPQNVNTVDLNTLYISASMSSIPRKEYEELRSFLIKLKPKLEALDFKRVICPLFDNPDYDNFDGNTKAIKENYIQMKQVEAMLIIYSNSAPSSVLVDIGYGLALCKKTVVFYRDKLPYILQDAGTNIQHIDCRHFNSYAEIERTIVSNGRQLFGKEEE